MNETKRVTVWMCDLCGYVTMIEMTVDAMKNCQDCPNCEKGTALWKQMDYPVGCIYVFAERDVK